MKGSLRAQHWGYLRLLGPGELIDAAPTLLRAQPALLFGLGVLSAMPFLACGTALLITGGAGLGRGELYLLAALLVAAQVPRAALMMAAFQTSIFPTRPLLMSIVLRSALRRAPALLGTRLLLGANLALLLVLVPRGLVPQQVGMDAGPFAKVLAVLSVGLGGYLAACFTLASPIVVIEQLTFFDAATRSSELLARAWPRGVEVPMAAERTEAKTQAGVGAQAEAEADTAEPDPEPGARVLPNATAWQYLLAVWGMTALVLGWMLLVAALLGGMAWEGWADPAFRLEAKPFPVGAALVVFGVSLAVFLPWFECTRCLLLREVLMRCRGLDLVFRILRRRETLAAN